MEKRIAIIAHTERNYIPYVEKYIRVLEEEFISYDFITWNREDKPEEVKSNEFIFFKKTKKNKFSKLINYLKYYLFVKKILKQQQYEKLIILTSVTGMMLYKYLLKNYQNMYLFDIRDYSFESLSFYKKCMNKLVENSALTTISSPGFLQFIDVNDKIVINHNIHYWQLTDTYWDRKKDILKQKPYKIGFIGGIRYFKENIKLIEALKNNPAYTLVYIGQPTLGCDLEKYCIENDITNIRFQGKFRNEQKPELYLNMDMVNSVYGNDGLEVSTALPNRLYESAIFKIPILVSNGTYLAEIVNKYHLGLLLDLSHNEEIVSKIDKYVQEFSEVSFANNCNKFLQGVAEDENVFYQRFKLFINSFKV